MIKLTAVNDKNPRDLYYIYLVVNQMEAVIPNHEQDNCKIVMCSGRVYTVIQNEMKIADLLHEYKHPKRARMSEDRGRQHYTTPKNVS